MEDDVEVLVHVSAPTTREDDDMYRSLADAYSEFVPCIRHGLTRSPSIADPELLVGLEQPLITTAPSIDKDSFGSFPSHLDSGNHSSSQEQSKSFGVFDPLEVDPTCSSNRLHRLERLQARWKQQSDSRPNAAGQPRSISQMPTSSGFNHTTFIEDSQLAIEAIESQLLDRWSATSEDSPEDDGPLRVHYTPPKASTGNISTKSQTLVIANGTAAPCSSASRMIDTEPGNNPLASLSAASLTITKSKIIYPLGSLQHPSFEHFPLEVYPPPPTVTVDSPGNLPSQITKLLEMLKLQNPGRYQPSRKLRALAMDERGHWAVNCGTLAHDVQQQFWSTLADDVRSGKLGWGVSLQCVGRQPYELGQIHLYCWGEIVEHTWLSLWLCSRGTICGLRSAWHDADDEPVIEVA